MSATEAQREADAQHRKGIWQGDPERVIEARRRYEEDPEKELIPYASALYSFRHLSSCVETLIELQPEISLRGLKLASTDFDRVDRPEFANRADTLSTICVWLSDQLVIPVETKEGLRVLALRLCDTGLHAVYPWSRTAWYSHTYYLLNLTWASLNLSDEYSGVRLDRVAIEAPMHVKDANQKARIFIKLGALFRKRNCGNDWRRGLYWGIRGCLVWGVPLNVRAKGLAALLGVER